MHCFFAACKENALGALTVVPQHLYIFSFYLDKTLSSLGDISPILVTGNRDGQG